MAQIIEVPGRGEYEFPDDMSDEEIAAALRRETGNTGSGWQDFKQGLGSSLKESAYGLRDAVILGTYRGKTNGAMDAKLRAETDQRRAENPIPSSGAGLAGAVTGGLAATVPLMAVPGANTVAGSAALGGLYGLLQPVGTGESRLENARNSALLSGVSQAGMKVIGRIAQPVKNALSVDERAAVDALRREGVNLSVGQQTGSKAAQGIERALADNPVTGPQMARFADKQRQQFTTAAMRTAGETADNAGPGILGPARDRIGSGLNAIEKRYAVDANNPQFLTDLADLAARAAKVPNGQYIQAHIDDVINLTQNGKIPGDVAAKLRTDLAPLRSDKVVGDLASDLDEIIHNGLQASMQGTDDFAQYAALRSQYRNLKSISDTADTTARAQVSPATLASKQKNSKYTKNSFRYGTGNQDLAELARAGSTVVDRFPNSGTTARAMAQLYPAAGAAGLGYATGERDPMDLLKLAALGYAVPKGAVSAMTNPAIANYMARGVMMPPAMRTAGLLAQRALPAGLLSLQSSY